MNIHPESDIEHLRFVCVTDLDCRGRRSVTTDIEWVISLLRLENKLRDGDRLIYRDTDGRWDEVLLIHALEFAGFRALDAATRNDAIRHSLALSENG